jgi:hypothetical protein
MKPNIFNQHPFFLLFSGDAAGRHIHHRGTANGKRVQSNMAAKNHCTIMPDSDKETTLNALVGAAFGAAGQRCKFFPFSFNYKKQKNLQKYLLNFSSFSFNHKRYGFICSYFCRRIQKMDS